MGDAKERWINRHSERITRMNPGATYEGPTVLDDTASPMAARPLRKHAKKRSSSIDPGCPVPKADTTSPFRDGDL